jgi:hypothetical protein
MSTPSGWVNPIGAGLKPARIDMGVDYTGTGSLYAMGGGTILNVTNSGWPGGKFISLKLDQTGQVMYYAENIISHVSIGQKVRAGDLIGTAVGTYPYVEIGWADPTGKGGTMAAASGQAALGQSQGDPGKYSTAYGVSMSNLISSLGGPAGQLTPGGIQGTVGSGYPQGGTYDATGQTSSSSLPGCVPLIWVIWYAVCQAKKFGRNMEGNKRSYRRRKNGKRKRGSSRQTT